MANTVITSATKYVKVVFNDDAPMAGMVQGYFSKSLISEVRGMSDGFVVVKLNSGESFNISTDGALNTLTIDSIDGVAPTDNTDLCDKITGLM